MMENKIYSRLSIGIIIIFAVIRLIFAATHTVSGDACWHLSASRFIATENRIPLYEGIGRLEPFWAPPLFHFTAAFFYKIFLPINADLADLGMKFVSPLFGTMTVMLLYLISRRYFNERIAFYAMLFINFIPVFMDYSVLSYVESITAFFSVLSVYFMLKNMHLLSSLSLGLTLLSKYHAVFMYPMLLYLAYNLNKNNKKDLQRKLLIVIFVPLIISSVWFLRNFLLLGDPIWPFFNGIFHGNPKGTLFQEISFGSIFLLNSYVGPYLEFFGIPNGNVSLVMAYATPILKNLFWLWLTGTFVFMYQFLKGLKNSNKEKSHFISSIYILLVSYIFMFFIFTLIVGWFGSRLLLPIVPFMAIIWANGLNSIKQKNIFAVLIVLIGIGFLSGTAIKFATASNEWSRYNFDFDWVKSNTENDAVFFGNGQCVSYNTNRLVINHKDALDLSKIDYVWVNNEWKLDFPMNEDSYNKIINNDKLKIVYKNDDTGTVIYKVIR